MRYHANFLVSLVSCLVLGIAFAVPVDSAKRVNVFSDSSFEWTNSPGTYIEVLSSPLRNGPQLRMGSAPSVMLSGDLFNRSSRKPFVYIPISHPGGCASDGKHHCWTNCPRWGQVRGRRHWCR